ncbi:ubiquitin-associated protein 1 [Anthonomus grandis grandis]|uniref:ubiquitin-associated protein 1 n=1 Tax=Anthonomus grandis grandis TaxID=2921223 RepID=UPI002165A865|nr:ubiquitin-associated protein 1 [Anthonomus grandis grandis]
MSNNSYMDDVKVKISERYKPPMRISMPISFAQRISFNKQLTDNRPDCNFQFEREVIEKMVGLKEAKRTLKQERRQRLETAKKEFKEKLEKEKQETLDRIEKEQAEARLKEEARIVNAQEDVKINSSAAPISHSNQQPYTNHINSSSQSYFTKNGILMPIPATRCDNLNNILKPVPTTNTSLQPQRLPTLSKPFNLADFESDTSSPFDNVELKSINDLEELAQVLKTEQASYQPNPYPNNRIYQTPVNYSSSEPSKSYVNIPTDMKSYTTFPPNGSLNYTQNSRSYIPSSIVSQTPMNYSQVSNAYSTVNTTYNPISTYSQYSNPYVNPGNYQVPSTTSTYSTQQLNGYHYNVTPQTTSQAQLNNPYGLYGVSSQSLQKSNCKSVPDLVKSIERELDSTHLTDHYAAAGGRSISSTYTTTDVVIPRRPKSTDSVYPKTKVKDGTQMVLDRLSREQKEICRNINLMGFPLDRVVRVCEVVGTDQKKIVDHLLALSELLDLGFSEKAASDALVKNDNDRDKALELLIS